MYSAACINGNLGEAAHPAVTSVGTWYKLAWGNKYHPQADLLLA